MQDPLLQLFGIERQGFPEKLFVDFTTEINHQGAMVKNYSKVFFDEKYLLFDTLDVKEFEQCYNVFLISHKLHRLSHFHIRKLLNRLFKALGPDDLKRGRYSALDFIELINKNLAWIDLRSWTSTESNFQCDFFVDRELNEVRLLFYGLKK